MRARSVNDTQSKQLPEKEECSRQWHIGGSKAHRLRNADLTQSVNTWSLDRLYREYSPSLLAHLCRRVPPDQAADVVHEIFVRLMRSAGTSGHEIRSPEPFLRQAATNQIRDEVRRTNSYRAMLHRCTERIETASINQVTFMEARDQLLHVGRAMKSLGQRTRTIFLAHRVEGYTYSEISSMVGLSIKTVERHMTLAIRSLGAEQSPFL